MSPSALHCFDDNKNNIFNNRGNKGHELKNVTCKQTFTIVTGRKDGRWSRLINKEWNVSSLQNVGTVHGFI